MSDEENSEYEKRLKGRLLILKKYLEDWKLILTKEVWDKIEESLMNVKYDKNWEIDLNTVDGIVRSMALGVEFMDYRDKTKDSISLKEIQEIYFSMVENNFKIFYNLMLEKKSNPHQIASNIAYNSKDIDYIDNIIDKLIEDIINFWHSVNEAWYFHLEDDHESIKAIFWWDLFPSHSGNIASKIWIYTDTIVLPCPFVRTKDIFKTGDKQQRVYYLIKHALNILQYKELALADLKKPIIVVLADQQMLYKEKFSFIHELWERDSVYHASKIFGREFKNIEEVVNFWQDLDTIDKVMREIKDPRRVLFDTDFTDSLEIQIQRQLEEHSRLTKIHNPGLFIALTWLGRMGVSNELLEKAQQLQWTPLIEAPTSWEYFKWKLEYDAERIYWEKEYENMHIVKWLEWLNNGNLEWIGKIPPQWLIELRQTWAIDEIRSILGSNINELAQANPLDFTSTSKKVFQNMDDAIRQHQEKIKELKNKNWKIAGHDFGSWIIMWTAEIAAICIWTPTFWWAAFAVNQFLDAPKMKDLPKTITKIKENNTEKEELKKSPLGIIFKYKT